MTRFGIARLILAGALCGLFASAGLGHAQDGASAFPSKPIKIIVGFTPGGAPDLTARYLGEKLSAIWGQPVLVENRPGAGGATAAQFVAQSPADGYTLLSATSSFAVAPAINASLPFDPLKDFTAVVQTSDAPTWLLVAPSLGIKTFNEFVALAKDRNGQLSYSSSGIGGMTHFATEMIAAAAKIKARHIPFRGVPEMLTEVVAGRVDFTVSAIGAAIPFVKDQKLVALGITSPDRFSMFPEIQTMSEQGLPGFKVNTWTGLLAPANTPKAVVDKINSQINQLLQEPDTKQRWSTMGVVASPIAPEAFQKVIADDIATFTETARASGIQAQ